MTDFHRVIARCRKQIRNRLWLRQVLVAIACAAMFSGILAVSGTPERWLVIGAVVVALVALALTFALPRYRALTDASLANHFDRLFPEMEESTRLLLSEPQELSVLQTMQRERAAEAWPDCVQRSETWLPRVRVRDAALFTVLGLLITFSAESLRQFWQESVVTTPIFEVAGESAAEGSLLEVDVEIVPPAYTGLPAFSSDSLDLALPEGSTVRWWLRVEGVDSPLELDLGDDERLPLVADDEGRVGAEAVISRTGLYQVVEQAKPGQEPGQQKALGGIHTLTVTLDQAPRIRVIQPDASPLELLLSDPGEFLSHVEIRDEFGIGEVEIRASVAKGSGEGVKFRDELFSFHNYFETDSGTNYRRNWNLESMGMEPGDEIYFFVTATDNREPVPNVGRSETIIVRWLDEEPPAVLAEGFGIDVMPEYFKSQRQIIIETEQLISDRADLEVEDFDKTSRSLGQAQSDLKERYGQYLGDEFEHDYVALSDDSNDQPAEESSGDAVAFDFAGAEEAEKPTNPLATHDEFGHDHSESSPETEGSADDLIARFSHNHGTADIGPITERNPVGLMKRSIHNMWQAELHLLLSEPEEALPYEYEALKYLNLARQAERIYTRRLGFEPPPVSEEKRYAGELDEILNYDIAGNPVEPASDNDVFRSVYALLSDGQGALDEASLALLENATERLTEIAQQRPAMIRHAATLEQIRRSGQLILPECDDCLEDLRKASWSLSDRVAADPREGTRPLDAQDELQQEWLRRIEPGGNP